VEPPAGLDYDAWCGPAPKLPYMRARHHRWWRGNSAYGGGTLMDWIGHHNDIAHWGLGCESSGPVHVEARGWTWSKAKSYDTPVNFEIVSEYAGCVEGIISTNLRNGAKWIGEDGWVWVDRGKIEASNPEWLAEGFLPGSWKGYASPGHQRNFIDCVKSRAATAAPAENGHRSITPGHLGLISARLGRGLKWDPAKEQVVGDEEAQTALMKIEYRSDFTV
jgi:predicted dehydrogenase